MHCVFCHIFVIICEIYKVNPMPFFFPVYNTDQTCGGILHYGHKTTTAHPHRTRTHSPHEMQKQPDCK